MYLARTFKRWVGRLLVPVGVAVAFMLAGVPNAQADDGTPIQIAFFEGEATPLAASELAGERGAGVEQGTSSTLSGASQFSVILWDELSPGKGSVSATPTEVGSGTVSATVNGQPYY